MPPCQRRSDWPLETKHIGDLDILPTDIVFRQLPKSVTLNIKTPRIDIAEPFEAQIPEIEQVMQSIYRLLPYAKTGTV